MAENPDTGCNPSTKEVLDADRVLRLHPLQQRDHPSAVKADPSKLDHINIYGDLPKFYLDQPFTCRRCGKIGIWRARDQKWHYEGAKGHVDARAVECHECRWAQKTFGNRESNEKRRDPNVPNA